MSILAVLAYLLALLFIIMSWVGLFKPSLFKDEKTGAIPSRAQLCFGSHFIAIILLIIGVAMMPDDKTINTSKDETTAKQDIVANTTNTKPVETKKKNIPTRKFATVKEMFDTKGNYPSTDGSFKLLKSKPVEFILYPEIGSHEIQEGILSAYKYAALEGLLLTFAQTDVQEITFHVLPRVINNEKPISNSSREAVKLKITLKAKREDVANALYNMQIYDFDTLIDHGENQYAVAGSSASNTYNALRASNYESWKLINRFRVDKYRL